jgi:hypothetical protein
MRYAKFATKLMLNMPTKKKKGKPRFEMGLYLLLRLKRVKMLNLSSIIYAICSSFLSLAMSSAVCPFLFTRLRSHPASKSHLTILSLPAITAR